MTAAARFAYDGEKTTAARCGYDGEMTTATRWRLRGRGRECANARLVKLQCTDARHAWSKEEMRAGRPKTRGSMLGSIHSLARLLLLGVGRCPAC
ncbi:hypothetical protein Droror1_Dr00000539 [Drosera rotundifolia]